MSPSTDPVLLLHGQPGDAREWEQVRRAIGTRASTIAIDRPGWDGSGSASSLSGNVEVALGALDAAGVDRATVVGHSFGAAVGAWLAAAHPRRVRALVLVAPSANRASLYRLDYLLAAPITGYLSTVATLGGAGLALAAGPFRSRIGRQLALDEGYLRRASRLLRSPSAWRTFFAEQRILIRELPSLEARLGQIKAPTKIVVGAADWVVPISSARRLAEQIPDAELRVLARGGHLIPQQCPKQLAEVIVSAAGVDSAEEADADSSPR